MDKLVWEIPGDVFCNRTSVPAQLSVVLVLEKILFV